MTKSWSLGLVEEDYVITSPDGDDYWVIRLDWNRDSSRVVVWDDEQYEAAKAAGCPRHILKEATNKYESESEPVQDDDLSIMEREFRRKNSDN